MVLFQRKYSFGLVTINFSKLHILLLLTGCLWGLSVPVDAQSRRAYIRAGDKAVSDKDYGTAVQHYAKALERKSDDHQVMWKYAECARMLNAFSYAEKMYLELAAVEKFASSTPLLDFRLGEVLKNQGKYTAAVEAFERFLPVAAEAGPDFPDRVRVETATCRWAQANLVDTTRVRVTNLGKKINSPYSDFAPFIAGDTMFFSSYRFNIRGDKSKPRKKTTKVMFSVREGRARELTRGFPATDTAHVAHATFTADGHFLLLTLCKNRNASDIRCELWLAVQDIRKRWGAPFRLPEPVNLPGFTTTHPALGYDSLTEQLNLWFSSDRPGGQGGLDIWQVPLDTIWFCPCNVPVDSRKPMRMPRFETPPENLVAINTPGNEITPYFHATTRTLYFSSDHYTEGYGGYDIFRTKLEGPTPGIPQNAGPGLNTSYNDLYFVLRPDSKSGYLSSNRPGSEYLDVVNKACCNDIYKVQYPLPEEPPVLAETPPVQPRTRIDRPMIPIEQLQQREPEAPPVLADFVGLPLYFDNDEPDKRTRRTRTRKSYVETVLAYLDRQEEYREKFAAGLNGSSQEAAEEAIDIFFEQEVRAGYERLDQLCELLVTRLNNGEPVEVVIKGFTSPRAQSDYNLALGKRRISSVRNHFEAYHDGVLKPFIASGQLTISEASFGETTARSGISDALDDERNSVYNPDAARERRVEIVEIRENQ